MNEEQLQAIEERANAATPGEWEPRGDIVKDIAFEDDVIFYAADSMGPHIESGDWQTAVSQMRADSAFIAHARADVPALIAEVRSLHAKLDAVPEYVRYLVRWRAGDGHVLDFDEWYAEVNQEVQP